MRRPPTARRHVTNAHRPIARVALAAMAVLATLVVGSTPASAAGSTGGLSPTVFGGRLDMNGTGAIGGRDDSNAFFGQTDVIDGGIDCDAWGTTANAALPGDGVIGAADDCTLIGVDGSFDGVTIAVEDGVVVAADGVPFSDGSRMPALYNAANPFDQSVQGADFGWWALDGRVDVNLSGSIDYGDCARGVVVRSDAVGFGDATDGAGVLAASPLCPIPVAVA